MNRRRLTRPGYVAINEMMRLGMMIDVDHMSIATLKDVIEYAQDHDYPLNSGHNGPRGVGGHENGRTPEQYAALAELGGMAGVGWEGQNARGWLNHSREVREQMGGVPVGFGTDINSLVLSPPPPPASPVDYEAFPQAQMGARRWDYNEEGVAHYGLLPDYLRDMELLGGQEDVAELLEGAEYFARMWELSVQAGEEIPEIGACLEAEEGDHCIPSIEFGPYCPRRVWPENGDPDTPDREFDGNGPLMTATAHLEIVERRRLYAVFTMHAIEVDADGDPTGDRSEAYGEWRELLAEVDQEDPLAIIESVRSAQDSSVVAMSPAAGSEVVLTGDGDTQVDGVFENDRNALEELVANFVLVGDTGGDDITDDDDCDGDTRMRVRLNPITVRYGRLPEPEDGRERVVANVAGVGPYGQMQIRRGDPEFYGNGPEITATVRALVTEDRRQVEAEVHFIAQEINGDTYGEGVWREIIYTAPEGQRIVSFDSTEEVSINFISDAAGFQFIGHIGDEDAPRIQDGQNLVREFRIVGDTGGDDLSDDRDCRDDTQIAVEFHPLLLTLEDPPEPPPDTFEVEIQPDPTQWYCDLRMLGGDREFFGHGPRVRASIVVAPGIGGRGLGARLDMLAEEHPGDTRAQGIWFPEVWTAPPGQRIVQILSDRRSEVDFVARGHGVHDVRAPTLIGRVAERFRIVGDTEGDDISDDLNCDDDTRIQVHFNPIRLRMRRE